MNFGDDRTKHREHFRTDWHRYNLKLKMKGRAVVDEEFFDGLDDQMRDLVLRDWQHE